MSPTFYNLLALLFIAGIVAGIRLMNSPRTAARGNQLGAVCVLGGILLTLASQELLTHGLLWIAMAVGALIGYWLAVRVAMVQMPQLVAVFNGLGGGASAFAAFVVLSTNLAVLSVAGRCSGALALSVGGITLGGSAVAAAKLDRRLAQRPIVLPRHTWISIGTLIALSVLTWAATMPSGNHSPVLAIAALTLSLGFGAVLAIRVGGADMPVTISLLNSLSGVAASLAGLAVRDPMLVAAGAIVGAAGLILTAIMCQAANRSLLDIVAGKTAVVSGRQTRVGDAVEPANRLAGEPESTPAGRAEAAAAIYGALQEARTVLIVPGYGLALAEAQSQVRELFDQLERHGKEVRFAIHPLAGRMPGHMHVLLAEVEIPYEKLCDLDDVNEDFAKTDVAVVVGASDVVNPAATTAVDTPIYGMPILNVSQARQVIICNQDTQPGYSGVPNPLYEQDNVFLWLGNAAETVRQLVDQLASTPETRVG